MAKTLGIDLGTSSLGWAILDSEVLANAPSGQEAKSVIESGVVIFPEGMDREKSGKFISRAAERRVARAARRLIFRRKWRKILLLQKLFELKMCPISIESIQEWKNGKYPITDKKFLEWLVATPEKNPYIDRKKAAEGKVDLETLGRALYHIAQRRGFKSSRKEQLQALNEDDENISKKKAKESDLGVVKGEIVKLTEAKGDRTLGQYFYDLYKKGEKVRGRYTGRIEHYEEEFDRIAKVQELDENVAKALKKILFFQRPLRSQSHLVGWCELEKNRKHRRALVAHPIYEEFAAWDFINNFRVGEDGKFRPLEREERCEAFNLLKRRSSFIARDFFVALRKKCENLPSEMKHRDEANVPIMPTTKQFEDLEIRREDWQTALDALMNFDDLEKLQIWARARYGWDEKKARKFARTDPADDRASYSVYAIKNILPWVKKGVHLRTALFLAKLPDLINGKGKDFASNETEILEALNREEEAYREAKNEYDEKISNGEKVNKKAPALIADFWWPYFVNNWNLNTDDFKQLYIHSVEVNTAEETLQPVDLGSYRNPLVTRALTVLRRLINRLRKSGKINYDTKINIELAREVNSSNECCAIEKYQRDNEDERNKATAELEKILKENKINCAIDDDLILRYLLWNEQGGISVYTGQSIAVEDIVRCDIEHTIPRSVGGTNRRENLTLCEPWYNRDIKKNKLPSECPNATNEWTYNNQKYPMIKLGVVLKNWNDKLNSLNKILLSRPRRGGDPSQYNQSRQKWLVTKMKRDYLEAKLKTFTLTREEVEKSGFMPRQLVDTGAMTRRAVEYLRTRYLYVYPVNGVATAFARKAWGIQKENEKDRNDHTHHAVDAMVIAALSLANFKKICSAYKNYDEAPVNLKITPPFENFAEHVFHARESILVKRMRQNCQKKPYVAKAKKQVTLTSTNKKVIACGTTVRGTLHNDTIYGRITLPGTNEEVTVIRKTIAGAANFGELLKLADTAVDKVVGNKLHMQIEKYRAQGIAENKLKDQVYWMNEEKKIPLQKIRVAVSKPADPNAIRKQAFESNKDYNNDVYISSIPSLLMCGWKNEKDKWVTKCTNLLDVAKGDYCDANEVFENGGFVLYPGQFVLVYENSPDELEKLSQENLAKRLYFVVQTFGERSAIFRYHREARPSTVLKTELPKMIDSETKKPLKANGESQINYKNPNPLLLLSVGVFAEHMLFEGRDFLFTLDGEIKWMEK